MAQEIKFEPIDVIGQETLDVISQADRFNYWMYETIRPHCKGAVLEIGSGLGNISQCFLNDQFSITLTDIRANYSQVLRQKFQQHPTLQAVKQLDLTDPKFDQKFASLFNSFDTVFALNVVEHIKDDALALKNAKKLLRKDGHLVILVPSYQLLFNKLDTELGHYRRYTKQSLSKVFEQNKISIIHKSHFNFMGIFAWFISGRLQANNQIPDSQMRLYNFFVPIFKWIDALLLRQWGLSTIVVGKK